MILILGSEDLPTNIIKFKLFDKKILVRILVLFIKCLIEMAEQLDTYSYILFDENLCFFGDAGMCISF